MNLSKWFRGMRGKLITLIAVPSLMIVALFVTVYVGLEKITSEIVEITDVRMPSLKGLEQMNEGQIASVLMFRELVSSTEASDIRKHYNLLKEDLAQVRKGWELYAPLPQTPEEAKAWDAMVPLWKSWESEISRAMEMAAQGNQAEAGKYYDEKAEPFYDKTRSYLNQIIQINYDVADVSRNSSQTVTARTKVLSFGVGAVAILFSAIFGLFTAALLANRIATAVGQVGATGTEVNASSDQLSAASQQVSAGSSEAASSLEETVSSIEEISSMIKMNADNSKQAAALSQASSEAAEQGDREIHHLIRSMNDISESSKKIEDIINVIDDIAFQTNLLALNAAVEAARAGEQGKGFAVVAEAVRNLAQRSSAAAKDINGLIKDAVSKIENGNKVATSSGKVLKDIVNSVKKVTDLNNEIASASMEQANGISQISKAMNELDTATQRNAAASEEVAAAAEEMAAQAITLAGLVQDLTWTVDGKSVKEPHSASHEPMALDKQKTFSHQSAA